MNTVTQPIVAALFTLLTALTSFAVSASDAEEFAEANAAWARVLTSHVDERGRVDFAAIAESPDDLKRYVEVVASYGPESNPGDFSEPNQVLAYHANTYNALAMWGVIERDIPDGFTSFFKRASFFKFRSVNIDGSKTNLYDYENKVIRPLDEPRMHFVLNCMVRDCPRLPQQPFTADDLENELQQASLEFFSEERKLSVDHDKREIWVSAILDFYTVDFVSSGKARDLPTYINPFLEAPLPADYKVKYVEYDWRINAQP